MLNKRIGILGLGEVGTSIQELYKKSFFGEVSTKDLNHDNLGENLDVLNICIPYTDDFVKIVVDNIKKHKPKLVIIYSTVEPYTTNKVKKKSGGTRVVHVPVRGVHPHLAESDGKFKKYIGCERVRDGWYARKHLKYMQSGKCTYKIYRPAVITEVNKLVSTTYYGVCIAYTDYVNKVFKKFNIPFESFEEFNESYNRGYRRLGMRKVNRPTLYPPKGSIGGHCIVPNAKIMQKYLDHKLIQSILDVK